MYGVNREPSRTCSWPCSDQYGQTRLCPVRSEIGVQNNQIQECFPYSLCVVVPHALVGPPLRNVSQLVAPLQFEHVAGRGLPSTNALGGESNQINYTITHSGGDPVLQAFPVSLGPWQPSSSDRCALPQWRPCQPDL